MKLDEPYKFVDKKWGSEKWLSLTENYCFKQIKIFPGELTSLQLHKNKEETNFVLSGKGYFYYLIEDKYLKRIPIGPGFFVQIKPGEVHRFEAETELVLMEASSPQVDDVVRLQDKYGREGTSAA